MRSTRVQSCPSCGAPPGPEPWCPRCGAVPGRRPGALLDGAPASLPASAPRGEHRSGPELPVDAPPAGGLRALLLGLALAPVFLLTPYLQLVGWFLAALTHELGHTLAGWLSGRPAVPAISLGAEAATAHGEPSTFVALLMLGGCVAATTLLERPGRHVALAAVLVLQPLLAWTEFGEVVHLLAGHLGELVFAAICLYRAWTSKATSGENERVLYAVVGFHLVLSNARLSLGLALSAAARAEYRGNGSFGLENDYVRLAEHVLGMPLATLGLLTALPALALGVAAFWPALRGWMRSA